MNTTPGSASANSYCTEAEYEAYWESRPNNAVALAYSDIESLLQHACRVLDAAFTWTGSAVSSTQALCWPRSGMFNRNGFAIANTEIPVALKNAQCELAGQMASADRTADNDAEKAGLTSLKAGPVTLEFRDPTIKSDTDVAAQRVAMLSRIIPDAVALLLVPSWYTVPSVKKPVAFQML